MTGSFPVTADGSECPSDFNPTFDPQITSTSVTLVYRITDFQTTVLSVSNLTSTRAETIKKNLPLHKFYKISLLTGGETCEIGAVYRFFRDYLSSIYLPQMYL